MKHLVLKDGTLNGWEYGMLRSFEQAIREETGASLTNIPEHRISRKYLDRVGHGMSKAGIRTYLPKQSFYPDADVLWYVLMELCMTVKM